MTTDLLAETLLHLMPWAWAAKTMVFALLVTVMMRQDARTSLGRWITWMFAATAATSAVMTAQTWYLDRIADADDIDSPRLWLIVTGTVVFPVLVTACGVTVAYLNYKLDHMTDHDDGEKDGLP